MSFERKPLQNPSERLLSDRHEIVRNRLRSLGYYDDPAVVVASVASSPLSAASAVGVITIAAAAMAATA